MERLKIYKVNKSIAYALLIIGAFFLIAGIGFLIHAKFDVFTTSFSMSNWSPLLFVLEGILFTFLGYINLRSGKYYIQWDENTLTWLLPGNRQAETVQLADIRGVTIHMFKIHLELADGEKTIHLDNVQFTEIRRIKEKLEKIKLTCEKVNQLKNR